LAAGLAVLAGALALLALAAPLALGDVATPQSGGSPNADKIAELYKIALYIAIVVFVGVESTLIYSLVKYRARRGGREAQQIRGNTALEIGWTVGAVLIVVALSVITFVYLGDITTPAQSGTAGLRAGAVELASLNQPEPPGPARPLRIGVNGQQFVWRYDYLDEERLPGGQPLSTYYEMVVPIDTTVTLQMTSQDVVHSWWIPELGGKADAVPGHTNETWFKISRPGVYGGQCAELCGEGHADHRARVRAVSLGEYNAWVGRQRQDLLAARDELASARKQREGPPREGEGR